MSFGSSRLCKIFNSPVTYFKEHDNRRVQIGSYELHNQIQIIFLKYETVYVIMLFIMVWMWRRLIYQQGLKGSMFFPSNNYNILELLNKRTLNF